MKISVTTNFGLNEAQLETQSAKLRDLLGELDRKHGVTAAILDVNEEVHSGYLIAINGQPLEGLRGGLDSELHDGDTVLIYGFFIMGGG